MARVSWVTANLKEAGWQISGLTHRNHIRLQSGVRLPHKSKPSNYTELIVVNMADGWREGTCEYPGRSVWNALEKKGNYYRKIILNIQKSAEVVLAER